MTSQHAMKQEARALMARRRDHYGNLLTYTKALELIKLREAFDLREFSSKYDQVVLEQAAAHILAGGGVVVFGFTMSGKSTVLHAVMEKLQGYHRTLLFTSSYGVEKGFKTEDPLYSKLCAQDVSQLPAQTGEDHIFGLVELYENEPGRMLERFQELGQGFIYEVHAADKVGADVRTEYFSSLATAELMHLEVTKADNGERTVSIV